MACNEQEIKEILESDAKRICVIAGPGSGKTQGILIPKAKQLVSSKNIDVKEILLLTFSRLAALDLKTKVKALNKVPLASTLHSHCLSFLISEDNHEIRKRINSILLDFEKKILISDLKIIFPDKDKKYLKKMLEQFSAGWAIEQHDKVFNEDDEKRKFKSAVLNWLNEYEAAMMGEIVYFAVDLAKKLRSDRLLPEFIKRTKFILIDEFQDLNRLEQEFIEILGENSKLLMVLGDPNQSIYSFKFAHPDGIVNFSNKEDVFTKTLPTSGRCAEKIIDIANKILVQADPNCKKLKPRDNAEEGEVKILANKYQEKEFEKIFYLILEKINLGVRCKDILVLVPRKKLGMEFANYANNIKIEQKIDKDFLFIFTIGNTFNEREEEKILEFSLLANSESILHLRSYLGLKDNNHFAKEISELKEKYGSLKNAYKIAKIEDFDIKQKKLIYLVNRIIFLKELISSLEKEDNLEAIFLKLFPENDIMLSDLRNTLLALKEEGDTVKDLYDKFIDYSRTIHLKDNVIRIITLMASKGLEADHVFIMGCNNGNIPGANRSVYLTDKDHKDEQRRLLYVGITRAIRTLTISWSRNILFSQAKGQHTSSVGTTSFEGKRYSRVAISEFLQDLN